MVSKRLLGMAVPVVLVALLLGACGNKNESANSTTSTSEAESPIGDQSENAQFCTEFVSETEKAKANSQELETVMVTLSTDAPTEIQPAFEQLATGVNNSTTSTTTAQQNQSMEAAWTQVQTFMAKACPDVDITEMQTMLGIDASSSGTTTTTKHS